VLNHQFRAFNTDIIFCLIAKQIDRQKIIDQIETSAKKFEKKFSRFDPGSELNAINNKNTMQIKVSVEMLDLLIKAKKAYSKSQGIFDPTILKYLEAAGYNQSFEIINASTGGEKVSLKTVPLKIDSGHFSALKIEKLKSKITSPIGMKIDLGGIAKGSWVDRAANILQKYSSNFWISAGGDIFLKGKNIDGKPWQVGVQNPLNLTKDLLKIQLPNDETGIATSGITYRQGFKGKKHWHHLIDPRSGRPAQNSILSVSVIAKSTIDADIMAKTVLLMGIKKGLAYMNSMPDHACIIIDKNLKQHYSSADSNYETI